MINQSCVTYSISLILSTLCSPVCANYRVHYGLMVVLVCLRITLPLHHHYADAPEGIELPKCLPGTSCQVCV